MWFKAVVFHKSRVLKSSSLRQLLYSIAVGVMKTTTVETTNEYFSKNEYGEHFPESSELTRTFVLLSNI